MMYCGYNYMTPTALLEQIHMIQSLFPRPSKKEIQEKERN